MNDQPTLSEDASPEQGAAGARCSLAKGSALNARQQALLDAIPADDDWHRIPRFTLAQTLLSLVNRQLVKLKPRPGFQLSHYYQITYADAYLVRRCEPNNPAQTPEGRSPGGCL